MTFLCIFFMLSHFPPFDGPLLLFPIEIRKEIVNKDVLNNILWQALSLKRISQPLWRISIPISFLHTGSFNKGDIRGGASRHPLWVGPATFDTQWNNHLLENVSSENDFGKHRNVLLNSVSMNFSFIENNFRKFCGIDDDIVSYRFCPFICLSRLNTSSYTHSFRTPKLTSLITCLMSNLN